MWKFGVVEVVVGSVVEVQEHAIAKVVVVEALLVPLHYLTHTAVVRWNYVVVVIVG